MHIKWLKRCCLHLFRVILINSLIVSCANSDHHNHQQLKNVVNDATAAVNVPPTIADSDNNHKFSVFKKSDVISLNENQPIDNGTVQIRKKRANLMHGAAGGGIVAAAVSGVGTGIITTSTTQQIRLIDEKECPEIRNLCSNLRDGADDLPVLECIQTFLSNQIENLSDECQHKIWQHTGKKKMIQKIAHDPCHPV